MNETGCSRLMLLVVLTFICLYFILPLLMLATGWFFFPELIVGELQFSLGLFILAIVVGVAATFVAHNLLTRVYGQLSADRVEKDRCWRIGWTIRVVATLTLFLGAALSLMIVTCVTVRIFASDDPNFGSGREAVRRSQSSNNLKQIVLGVHNYHDTFTSLPAGGTLNEFGEMQHGWMTALLPYVEQGDLEVNWDLPWSHVDQGDTFKTRISSFQNPSIESSSDAEGYALSHYAANCRVMGGRKPLTFRDITDGTSNTLLSGEVNHDFKPWGHPVNWRDPANGINRPGGFGSSRYHRGAQFALVDGSTRFISQDIDPEVLKALATPDGKEDLKGTIGRD